MYTITVQQDIDNEWGNGADWWVAKCGDYVVVNPSLQACLKYLGEMLEEDRKVTQAELKGEELP